MIVRYKVAGFKNLNDVEIFLGPFNCVAGLNGVGKSNLFDSLRFLSYLSTSTTTEAAHKIRALDDNYNFNIKDLFYKYGVKSDLTMKFEVDMIIPSSGSDDFGQVVKASSTFLKYTLTLRLNEQQNSNPIEILREELKQINKGEARKLIKFPYSTEWFDTVIRGKRSADYISTEEEKERRIIKLHQDQRKGKALQREAKNLPRTIISGPTGENPTVMLAKREMQSWRLLHLEPSALREPDRLENRPELSDHGKHLPATLNRLNIEYGESILSHISRTLYDLNEDVRQVYVNVDQTHNLLSLHVKDMNGTDFEARSLSDGTLRFLALAVIEANPGFKGVICLEEPENGIHPKKIPSMIELLKDIANDPEEKADPEDNPLRQVIINTHSPAVVSNLPEDSVIFIKRGKQIPNHPNSAVFSHLSGTWRDKVRSGKSNISKNDMIYYLTNFENKSDAGFTRVVDRPEYSQILSPGLSDE